MPSERIIGTVGLCWEMLILTIGTNIPEEGPLFKDARNVLYAFYYMNSRLNNKITVYLNRTGV